jgi:CDP-glucose 4,6-dehydratase
MTRGLPDPKFWRGRRVLLTGHTGFKGAWAALWLAEMGADVTGLALAPDTTPNLFDLAKLSLRMHSHLGDMRDAHSVRAVVGDAKPEIVIHMAAQALVRRSYREPADTFATNVMGTVNLLEAARDAGKLQACLVVTSDKVYENDGAGVAFGETAQLGGHDPYSASKAATEIVVASYRRSYFADARAKLATARGGNVIGGGDFGEDRIVPDIWRAHRAKEPLVLRYPEATRPWQHVLDCVGGYLVYAERLAEGATSEVALNFGPRDTAGGRVRDLVAAMQRALGGQEGWVHAPGPLPAEMPALALSCEKAERVLGWRARLNAHTTIEWTADWYRASSAGGDAADISRAQLRKYIAHE